MSADKYFDDSRPPDEAWWSREFHRSEKLVDDIWASFEGKPAELERFIAEFEEAENPAGSKPGQPGEPPAEDLDAEALLAALHLKVPEYENEDERPSPEDEADFRRVAALASAFLYGVFNLPGREPADRLLVESAGEVSINLASGHALGYDDECLCGNIVKCRWALSNVEFCREMLEQAHERTGSPQLAALVGQSRELIEALRNRIATLKARVWW